MTEKRLVTTTVAPVELLPNPLGAENLEQRDCAICGRPCWISPSTLARELDEDLTIRYECSLCVNVEERIAAGAKLVPGSEKDAEELLGKWGATLLLGKWKNR